MENSAKQIALIYKQQRGTLKQKALQVGTQLNIEIEFMSKDFSDRKFKGALGVSFTDSRLILVLSLKTKFDLAIFFHEIAHIILNHSGNSKSNEIEADKFSDEIIDSIYGNGGYLYIEKSETFFYKNYTDRLNLY